MTLVWRVREGREARTSYSSSRRYLRSRRRRHTERGTTSENGSSWVHGGKRKKRVEGGGVQGDEARVRISRRDRHGEEARTSSLSLVKRNEQGRVKGWGGGERKRLDENEGRGVVKREKEQREYRTVERRRGEKGEDGRAFGMNRRSIEEQSMNERDRSLHENLRS